MERSARATGERVERGKNSEQVRMYCLRLAVVATQFLELKAVCEFSPLNDSNRLISWQWVCVCLESGIIYCQTIIHQPSVSDTWQVIFGR